MVLSVIGPSSKQKCPKRWEDGVRLPAFFGMIEVFFDVQLVDPSVSSAVLQPVFREPGRSQGRAVQPDRRGDGSLGS